MLVYGGDSGYECLDDVWMLDLTHGSEPKWTAVSAQQVPDGRYQHTAMLFGDLMYVLGGKNCRGESIADCLALDLSSSTWMPAGKMPLARSDFALCSLKDKVYGRSQEDRVHHFTLFI
jgi:hypothetical protein